MKRTSLLLATLALGGTLLVSSGAVPLFEGPTDDIREDVELYPSDGPNGKFAYLDDDGELVIDISRANPNVEEFDGVNDGGITTFDDVFRVRYNGSQYAKVWLTHDSDAVTFYSDGETIESEANSVTLGPEESAPVGIRIDTTGNAPDRIVRNITIHASVAEPETTTDEDNSQSNTNDLSISGLPQETTTLDVNVTHPTDSVRAVTIEHLRPDSVVDIDLGQLYIVDNAITLDGVTFESTTAGNGNLTFSQRATPPASVAAITNESGIQPLGYFTLDHSIANSDVENVTFRFSANGTYIDRTGYDPANLRLLRYGGDGWTVLNVTREIGSPGWYHYTADSPGLSTFAVGVQQAQFVTTDLSVTPTSVQAGDSATVRATVENRGTVSGETTLTLYRNESPVETQTVTLDAGENTTVRFDVRPRTAGTHELRVGQASTTLTVESTSTPSPTPSPTEAEATATPTPTPESTPVLGEEPEETSDVSDEAAGFDLVALGAIGIIVALLAVVGILRRQRDA